MYHWTMLEDSGRATTESSLLIETLSSILPRHIPSNLFLFQFINIFLSFPLLFLHPPDIFLLCKVCSLFSFSLLFLTISDRALFSPHSFISPFSILYFRPNDFPLFLLLLIPSTPTLFYRTRVRSLFTLVTNSLTNSLTHSLLFSKP